MAKGSSPWTLPSLWLLALVLLNDLSLFGMTVDSGDKVNLWSRFDTSGVNLRSRLDDTTGGVRSGFLTEVRNILVFSPLVPQNERKIY